DADDNVETFFMHLLRGAGMKGLAGIKPVDGKFIRPLIETSREDILAYLKKNNLDFCVDSTNLDNVYFRNKIRNLLIPCISKNITGADFKKRIANTIKILREENDLLSQLAESFINDLKTASSIGADGKEVQGKEPEDEKTGKKGTYGRGIGGGKTCGKYLEIPLKKLENYPDAFKKRIIISAIEKIKGTSEDIKSISLDRILKFCFSGGESKKIKFSGDLNIIKESDGLAFFLKREKKKKSLTRYAVPQEIEFAGAGTWSRIASENGNETTLALKKLKLKFVSKVIAGNLNTIKNKRISDREAYLDYGKIKFPVFVGFYREGSGQKFVPLGMKNEKKLHDFFIDEKIPKSMRSEIPVFYDREKVIWLGGYRIDERARLDDSTKKIFNIKIIKI
ncbi:MAG: tRNA lysidine(34) synthetase TilS, partial [Actinobacteria bacterium]|nr:tRNA lysidine(34) synthetase TilS [Actinomycetota bacterium]